MFWVGACTAAEKQPVGDDRDFELTPAVCLQKFTEFLKPFPPDSLSSALIGAAHHLD